MHSDRCLIKSFLVHLAIAILIITLSLLRLDLVYRSIQSIVYRSLLQFTGINKYDTWWAFHRKLS